MKAWPWQAYFCWIWSVCSGIAALSAATQLEYSEFCKYLLVKWYLWLHPCTLLSVSVLGDGRISQKHLMTFTADMGADCRQLSDFKHAVDIRLTFASVWSSLSLMTVSLIFTLPLSSSLLSTNQLLLKADQIPLLNLVSFVCCCWEGAVWMSRSGTIRTLRVSVSHLRI